MSQEGESLLNVTVTFRHTEPTPALKQYATEKVTHCISKYIQHHTEAQVTLSVEKQTHSAEVTVHSRNYDARCEASTADLYSAIDKVCDNLIAQLRKQKEKLLAQKYSGTQPETEPA